jgi:hypothetical protein
MGKNKNKKDDFYYIEKAEKLQPIEEKKEKYDLDEKDLPPVPQGTIKYELNLMGLPIFSRNKKIKSHISMTYEFSEKENEYLRIVPTSDNHAMSNKILQEFDEKIFYGLLRLYEKSGKRKIITDYPNLMKLSGIKYKGDLIKRTKDSLERMRNCNIIFSKIYYDPIAKQNGADYLKRTKSVNLVSSLETISFEKFQEMKESKTKEELKKNFKKHGNIKEIAIIKLNEDIIQNTEFKAFKYFQIEDLLGIENATARKLYIMLTKWRYWEKNDIIKRKVKFLASRIPLSWKKSNIPKTIRNLLYACEELKKINKIADYLLIKEGRLSESMIEFAFKKDILYSHNTQIGNETTGQEDLTITKIVTKEEQNKSPEEAPVIDVFNIPEEIIKLIKEEDQSDPEIQKNLHEYLISQGKDYVKEKILYSNQNATKNYSGYLANALKNDWGQGYLKRHNEQKKQKEIFEVKKAEENKEAKIKEEYNNYCKCKAIEYFNNMSEEKKKTEIELFENHLKLKNKTFELERFKTKKENKKEIDLTFILYLIEKYIKSQFCYDDWLIDN